MQRVFETGVFGLLCIVLGSAYLGAGYKPSAEWATAWNDLDDDWRVHRTTRAVRLPLSSCWLDNSSVLAGEWIWTGCSAPFFRTSGRTASTYIIE